MNGLPIDINLDDLVGAEVSQVCFGGIHVIMKFDKDIELTTTSVCILTLPSGETESMEVLHKHAVSICGLLGEQISDASRDSSGGLLLKFRSGAVLQVTNDSEVYESFQLRIGPQFFVA
jgi:hypothetical protein